jgi:glucosamine--fructose-6-phosphate aminotransferase (isomerizing)
MCGIVGYIGNREAYPILMKGLHRLEYRGYDSAGCALINPEDELRVYKAKGKVADLEHTADKEDRSGSIGIAHTRWATHGAPNVINAHPHVSQSGNIVLVHNGIIENYDVLRKQLKELGFEFKSETDTEVLVQVVEYAMNLHGCSLAQAVREALKMVVGAYAICVMDKREPNELVVARKSSPLVIGVSEGNEEFFVASDASPIAEYTKQMVYLNDEEMAVLKRGEEIQLINLYNGAVDYEVKEVNLDLNMLDKGGFPHFMLKEIFDQPAVLRDCMRGRIINEGSEEHPQWKVVLSAIETNRKTLVNAKRFTIVSCGTSWHAGLIGKQLFEHFCRIHTEVAYASEFRYSDAVVEPGDVVIAISQSGETADTLAAIEMAKAKGATIFGIVNSVGSSISRAAETGTYIHVGPEIGVASTKAFTGQVTTLTLIALALGHARGTIDENEYQQVIGELVQIPDKIKKVLEQNDKIHQFALPYMYATNAIYLGRGWNYPVALEGALKLKEISYIHAEGYPAAEMKHGPIALIDENMPVVFVATHDSLYQKVISNMQEVISRKGRILAIVTADDDQIKKMVGNVIEIPQTLDCLAPLLSVIPLQMLSYHVACAKGLNVDQPRNLAKSVTVE